MKKLGVRLLIMGLLFTAVFTVKSRLNTVRAGGQDLENMAYLPGSEKVKPFMMGFHTTYAHYLWIRTVLYTGDHLMGDRQFGWLVQMVDMLTRLHPHFYEAYEFAGLMIPDLCDDPDAARIILERGMNHLGSTKWNVPFYLGMLYYKYYDDPERAAFYISQAARIPGPHKHKLAGVAASLYRRSGKETDGMALLVFLYESSGNPEVRRHIYQKISAFSPETTE